MKKLTIKFPKLTRQKAVLIVTSLFLVITATTTTYAGLSDREDAQDEGLISSAGEGQIGTAEYILREGETVADVKEGGPDAGDAKAEEGTIADTGSSSPDGSSSQDTNDSVVVPTPAAPGCFNETNLVNSCRPLLGIFASQYPGVGTGVYDRVAQTEAHEQRIGRTGDVIRTFHPKGNNLLSNAEQYFLNRDDDPILHINWKPMPSGYDWGDAGGSNTIVNNYIDAGADAIKAAGERVMLTIYHEPENDMSDGVSCVSYANGASEGSPAQYRAMWQNVRDRFDAKGVDNVVWSMVYMGYEKWDCVVDDLWPGNDLVDWVMWDPYGASGSQTFTESVDPFYSFLTNNSTSATDYLSKPWGLAEFGNAQPSQSDTQAAAYWQDAQHAIKNNVFPKLRILSVFDSTGALGDHRTAFTNNGSYAESSAEHQAYKAFTQLLQ